MNPSTTWPSLSAYTAGMDWARKAVAICGFSSTLTLTSTTWPSVASMTFSRIGPSVRQGPHHGRPQVDDHGDLARALDDLGLERGVGDVDGHVATLPAAATVPAMTSDRRHARPSLDARLSAPAPTGRAGRHRRRRRSRRGWRRNVAGAPRPVRVRAHRRRPLQPHLPRGRRRRAPARAAPPAARPPAGLRPRHGPGAPDHRRPRRHPGAGRARPAASAPTPRSTARRSTSWTSSTATSSGTGRRPRPR